MKTTTTTFKFDEKTMNLLKELKERTGATSNSEIIRNALKLHDALSEATLEKNEKVILRSEKEGEVTEREVLLP